MKFRNYIKIKMFFVVVIIFLIIFIILLFNSLKINSQVSILLSLTITIATLTEILFEYYIKNRFYKKLDRTLEEMDKKYYISQIIKEADFEEGQILINILEKVTKSMNDEIFAYKSNQEEYKQYIETWIHEIKIPISCVSLLCENNKNEITKSIIEENDKIEYYVEQALYYARSTNLEKDFQIKSISLDSIVKETIKKYSKQLISCNTKIQLNKLDKIIYSDPKWLVFILGQIISNSIKYRKDSLTLKVYADEIKDGVSLTIEDDGIGIHEKDIRYVFEKGFTGENGRMYAKSTGIGLYLCSQLCEKMHHNILIKSTLGKGTAITIIFPKLQ